MNIIKKTESVEPCTESGWYAWDYELERGMEPEDIEALAVLGGSFLYLKQLKEPFYKVETQYMMVKGLEGRSVLRLSVYKEYEEELIKKVEAVLGRM